MTNQPSGALPGLGWRLSVLAAVVYLLFLNPFPGSLGLNLMDLAMSLVDSGSLELTQNRVSDVALREGRILSGLPPGASFVAALVYFVSRPLLEWVPAGSKLTALYVLCSLLAGIPAAVVTVHLVYRTAIRWGVSVRDACLTACLLAFGTMHFGYATGFYKKTLAAACLMAAFWLLASATVPGFSALRASVAGFLSSLAIGQDYPTVVIAAVLTGYFLWRRPGTGAMVAFLAGSGLAIFPVLAYHQAAFGSPWATAYQFRPDPEGNTLAAPRLGPFVFLFSTLLAASPCLVWSAVGWWRALRTGARRAEMVTIASIVLGTLLLISGWSSFYPHEASFGSRLILPMIPFAVLPMAFGLPATLHGLPQLVIGWSVGASLMAAQASLIPSNTIPPVYSLKVLGTSWGAGPLFSEALASWLGIPTLHLAIAGKSVTTEALLQPESQQLLVRLLLGQAAIKLLSLTVTAIAVSLLWRLVWRPVVTSPAWAQVPRLALPAKARRS